MERTPFLDVFSSSKGISVQRCVKWHQKWFNYRRNFVENGEIYDVIRFACQKANYEINYNLLITCNNQMKLYRQKVP